MRAKRPLTTSRLRGMVNLRSNKVLDFRMVGARGWGMRSEALRRRQKYTVKRKMVISGGRLADMNLQTNASFSRNNRFTHIFV